MEKELNRSTSLSSVLDYHSLDPFQLMVESVKDYAIFWLDPAGYVESWNIGAELIKGYKKDEIVGKHFSCFYRAQDIANGKPQLALETALAKGRYEEEGLRVCKDGSEFWANVTITALYDPSNNHIGFSAITRDITKPKRVEEVLRASSQFCEQIIQNAEEGIIVFDSNLHYLVWNQSMERLSGTMADEVIGKHVLEFFPQSQDLGLYSVLERSLAGEYVLTSNVCVSHFHTGKPVWIDSSHSPLRSVNGEIIGVIVIVHNITERKQAEEALAASEKRVRAILESEPECVKLLDRDGALIEMNPAGLAMIEADSAAQVVGQDVCPLILPEYREPFMDITKRVFEGESGELQFEIAGLKGTRRWLEMHATPLRDNENRIIAALSVTRDITERIKSEALLNGQKHALELIAQGAPLSESLDALLRILEAQSAEMLCSILLLDNDGLHLTHGAAPSLPEIYTRAIDGGAIGAHAGSCGTAAFIGAPVIVEDIATDPLWEDYRDLALPHGLRACWSTPIFDAQRRVLGAFACYFRAPKRPSEHHLQLIEMATQTAAIAIVKQREEDALRESEQRFRVLVEQAVDGFFVHDENGKFLEVNRRACESLGYARDELLKLSVTDVEQDLELESAKKFWAQIQPDQPLTFNGYHRRKDGTIFPVEVRAGLFHTGGERQFLALARDVTERKQAEEELQQGAMRLQVIAQAANVGLWDWDLRTNRVFYSPEWKRQIGYEDHEITNDFAEWQSRVHPDDLEHSLQTVHEYIKNPWPNYQLEFRFRHKDGSYRWILAQASLIYDQQDQAMRMLGSHVDITERKIAEQQLTEKSFLLSESQRIGHIGTWSYEFSNNQIQWSDETYRIYGVSPHTFVPTSESFFNLVHPDDRAKMQELVRACQFGEKPEELEFRIVRTDGSIRTLSGRGELLSGNDSAPARMVGTVQDITERKQAEEKQARLVALLEATPDLVGIANADGLPLFINKAGRRAFGIKDDEDLSKIHILDFRPEWAIPIIQEAFQEAIRLGVWTGETVLLNRDGHEIPVSQVIVAHKSADNKVRFFSSIMRDLTEQKKLEEQVRQSQKMDAIGQLAGGVAHDFNNLLTVISGYSELLLVKVPINDPMRESIKAISEAGERAASLTRQLLAFSRQTVMESKILDLNTIVSDTEKMLRRLIGEDILLTAVLDPTISRVKVDPGQIGQVLMNLAVNARDAMPKGGKLTIETGNIKLDEMYVRMHPEVQAGRYVMLVMSDTGCGMTPLIKSHIFEPFFTTKGVGKGTGLGLAVVHGIIMQSGGHVEVYSEPNLGTTFKIYLPAVDEEIETSDKLYADNHLRGTETLLLVEDEESVRELVCLVLQTHGYKVVQANDGKEALRMLERHNVRIDLLVTDVVMPGMGGRELAEFLLPKFPQMKALYMSGYTDDAVVRHGILQAEIDFIQKPYSPHALLRKIRQVLDRK